MKITVKRITSDSDSTVSIIDIDGHFQCFGLEDEYRVNKVVNETRIPAGTYKVGVRDVGGFHSRYKSRYQFHQGMLQVLDVPNFEYILIHTGNSEKDTAGCLLVGSGCSTVKGDMKVRSSRYAYRALYQKVINSALLDSLLIEFVDDDLS